MDSPQARTYIHRCRANGTYQSICWECFAVIATAPNEADLAKAECEHTCDRSTAYILRKLHADAEDREINNRSSEPAT